MPTSHPQDRHTRAPTADVLRAILKKVSRSFYLSLRILPASVRQTASLAYLFCRAADTIADTRLLPRPQRLQALTIFQKQFLPDGTAVEELDRLQSMLLPQQVREGERQLFASLAECFRIFEALSPDDRALIRELVHILTKGMVMDLTCFPGETAATACALPDWVSLDTYTYYVAGVVGEFWTKLHALHLSALRQANVQILSQLGVRFGQGLQMTNILKDMGKDLAIGRCYVPEPLLAQYDIRIAELCDATDLEKFRPVLARLVQHTIEHLDQACSYIQQLPRCTVRLRLSCMWPLLFAIRTLKEVCRAETLLHPQSRIKISRRTVYTIIGYSCYCLLHPQFFSRFYLRLRCDLLQALTALDGRSIKTRSQ